VVGNKNLFIYIYIYEAFAWNMYNIKYTTALFHYIRQTKLQEKKNYEFPVNAGFIWNHSLNTAVTNRDMI
jgi:hypothetical protein